MKLETALIGLAAAATGVAGQSSPSPNPSLSAVSSPPATPMVVTMTIDDCSSTLPPTIITVTNDVTVTYCPTCNVPKSSTPVPTPTPVSPEVHHTTVYTTHYMSLCTTGSSWYTTPVVYTVTESCTDATASWASKPNYVPPGYTTTVVECHKCAGPSAQPATLTLTQPCDCTHSGFYAGPTPAPSTGNPPADPAPVVPAPNGPAPGGPAPSGPAPAPGGPAPSGPAPAPDAPAPSAPAPAPDAPAPPPPTSQPVGVVSQISDGQVQAPAGTPPPAVVSQISDGQVQAPAGTPPPGHAVSPVPEGPAPVVPKPGSTTTTVGCPGPHCGHAQPPAASTPGSTTVGCPGPQCKATTPVPYKGSASSILGSSRFAVYGSVCAVFVGGLALML